MGRNRNQKFERAAERKAAADAREAIARAERAVGRSARMRKGPIWDAVLAVIIGMMLFTAWKVIILLAGLVAVR
jgi:hypothetical protein